ncbi:hypothetical protein GGX14DRAFT_669164 [Mycena pura]|uniref:Uncharacterized protein n=1 Tax=Mycena pura TaxID=153505 RepID=A0AAD6YH17_9AGAR|nr:hypothetical protein GGX14DRAFT_669164 [Mycena pura]
MPADDAENIIPNATRECKKCHRAFPSSEKFAKCGHCRDIGRASAARKRAEAKGRNEAAEAAVRQSEAAEDRHVKRVKRRRVDDPESRADSDSGGDADHPFYNADSDIEDSSSEVFATHQLLFATLRARARSATASKKPLEFIGSFRMVVHPHESERERVQLTAQDVWKATGYRFTVRDNSKLKSGHKTRYFCSQDEGTKKASKPSQKPDAKHRENPGMTRFPCNGRLTISFRLHDESTRVVAIRLKHSVQHAPYYDVSLPSAAADIIRANIDWSTPSELITRVQAQFPSVTANQVGEACRSFTEVLWKRES